jgi:hypothetical protein
MKSLLEINEFPVFKYAFRLLLACWIYFACTKLHINPIFFGLTIAIAILVILTVTEVSIVVNSEELIIKRKKRLLFYNKEQSYCYSDLRTIKFEKGKVDGAGIVVAILTEFVSGRIWQKAELMIEKKDGSTVTIASIGSQFQNEKLIKIVTERIKKTTYNKG